MNGNPKYCSQPLQVFRFHHEMPFIQWVIWRDTLAQLDDKSSLAIRLLKTSNWVCTRNREIPPADSS